MSSIVVAGSGRSGTTWILDLLANANGLRTIFEPLKECAGEVARAYQNRFIPIGAAHPQLEQYFDRIFRGDMSSIWTDYRVVPERLMPGVHSFRSRAEMATLLSRYRKLWRNYRESRSKTYSGVAVKLIRANLMLDWLVDRYKIPIVCIVRHPCAVIESKLRLDARAKEANLRHGQSDWNPYPVLRRYLDDSAYREAYPLASTTLPDPTELSEIDAHAALWCIENAPVLASHATSGYCMAFYEDLVTGNADSWARLVRELGLSKNIDRSQLSRPSGQASADFRRLAAGHGGIDRWCERLSDSEKSAVERVLKNFQVKQYSVSSPLPLVPQA